MKKPIDAEKARKAAPALLARLQAAHDGKDACLLWTGAVSPTGHGRASFNGSVFYVHRVLWVAANGADPGDKELDHLCRTPACGRHDHLEPVDGVENLRRSRAKSATALRTGHCVNGHSLIDPTNVYMWRRARHCRTCRRTTNRERYAKDPARIEQRKVYLRQYRANKKAG